MGLKEIRDIELGLERDAMRGVHGRAGSFNSGNDACGCDDSLDLSEEIERIIDSDDPAAAEYEACGPLQEADEVEGAIQGWIVKMAGAGYYESDAQQAVFDALADMVERGVISDCPDVDSPRHKKAEWVRQFNHKVYAKLVTMGIDLEDNDGDVHTKDRNSLDT